MIKFRRRFLPVITLIYSKNFWRNLTASRKMYAEIVFFITAGDLWRNQMIDSRITELDRQSLTWQILGHLTNSFRNPISRGENSHLRNRTSGRSGLPPREVMWGLIWFLRKSQTILLDLLWIRRYVMCDQKFNWLYLNYI